MAKAFVQLKVGDKFHFAHAAPGRPVGLQVKCAPGRYRSVDDEAGKGDRVYAFVAVEMLK